MILIYAAFGILLLESVFWVFLLSLIFTRLALRRAPDGFPNLTEIEGAIAACILFSFTVAVLALAGEVRVHAPLLILVLIVISGMYLLRPPKSFHKPKCVLWGGLYASLISGTALIYMKLGLGWSLIIFISEKIPSVR